MRGAGMQKETLFPDLAAGGALMAERGRRMPTQGGATPGEPRARQAASAALTPR